MVRRSTILAAVLLLSAGIGLATARQIGWGNAVVADRTRYARVENSDTPKIAFASKRDGNWEIYVMDADGRRQTRLTTSALPDRFPVWSPDGGKIAFGSERAGKWELWVMNADGSNPTRLTQDVVAKAPRSWSSDGKRIVFKSNRAGNREIYSVEVDGAQLTRLTNNSSDDQSPSWSPDGSRIAFTSWRDGNPEIYVMRWDGARQERYFSLVACCDDGDATALRHFDFNQRTDANCSRSAPPDDSPRGYGCRL